MNNVFYYSDTQYKQLVKEASGIDLSTGQRGLIPTIAKLKNEDEYPGEAIKHIYETFIIVSDTDGCLHYIPNSSAVTVHKAKLFDGGYVLIVTANLQEWKRIVLQNDRLHDLNQIQTLLEQKYPRLFIEYSKVKVTDVSFELVKK